VLTRHNAVVRQSADEGSGRHRSGLQEEEKGGQPDRGGDQQDDAEGIHTCPSKRPSGPLGYGVPELLGSCFAFRTRA
jgi:hypothetical protein